MGGGGRVSMLGSKPQIQVGQACEYRNCFFFFLNPQNLVQVLGVRQKGFEGGSPFNVMLEHC